MAPPVGDRAPIPNSRSSRRKLPRVVWAAAWVSFFADFSTELVYGVLPAFYLHTISLSIITLGLIEGVAESVVALTKFFSGSLSDHTRRRPIWMAAGYTISAAAKPLIALVSSGLAVGLLRATDRFGKGIRGAPRDALVAEAVEEQDRGRAFGVQRALDHAGALAGGLAAAALLATGMFLPHHLFLLSAIPGAAAVLVILLFVREPSRPAHPIPGERRRYSIRRTWRSTTPQLKRYLIPASVFALANASDILLLAIAYERFLDSGFSQAASLAQLPLLWALLHVIKSLGSAHAGSFSDRSNRIAMMRIAWVVYAMVYALAAILAAGAPAWLAWPMFAIYGLYTILAEAPEKALIADFTPDPATRGAAYGLIQCATGLLALPATVIAGALWLRAGPAWAFGADALLALLGAALLSVVGTNPNDSST